MAQANQGSQRIGWKFSTPLQADYLNTFIAGFSSPGLLTRPSISYVATNFGANVLIQPFSLLIEPEDKGTSVTDENGEKIIQKLVKITTTSEIKISMESDCIALGFTYSFAPGTGTQSQWYGEVIPLSLADIQEFNGIVIATVEKYTPQGETTTYYSLKTNGADISDMLLFSEGWNPNKWLSVVHPKRSNGIYNKLEVRAHNKLYKGYINGHAGFNYHENFSYQLEEDPVTNPDGIRGQMPNIYNLFKIQSDGFNIAETADELPIDKTSGGVFAMVDASRTAQMGYSTAFTNNLIINPVTQEEVNIYYDNNTLFIK